MDSSERLRALVLSLAVSAVVAIIALVWASESAQRVCAKELAALGSYNPEEIRRICK